MGVGGYLTMWEMGAPWGFLFEMRSFPIPSPHGHSVDLQLMNGPQEDPFFFGFSGFLFSPLDDLMEVSPFSFLGL